MSSIFIFLSLLISAAMMYNTLHGTALIDRVGAKAKSGP